jgi:hypothetical protein
LFENLSNPRKYYNTICIALQTFVKTSSLQCCLLGKITMNVNNFLYNNFIEEKHTTL